MGSGAITLEDVGRHAGVSRATASLVLRNSTRVSEATTQRVREAMRELGYVYNRQAASMRDSRSMLIGLIATDITNPFFAAVTMAIERVVREAGYTLLAGYSGDDLAQQEDLLRTMTQHRVDGVMVQPAIGTNASGLVGSGATQVVQYVRHTTDDLDFIGLDDVAGGRAVGRHLMEIGVRRLAYLGGIEDSSTRRGRVEGLSAELAEAGIELDPRASIATPNNMEGGAHAAAELLDGGYLPEAIVAHSDAAAFGVYGELRRRGLAPGTDVAIAAFDDVPMASTQFPALTTVATDKGLLGERIAQALLDRIHDPDAPTRIERAAPALRLRASTTSWRRRA